MSTKCPTVAVKHDDGYCIINESDFDPKIHKEYTGKIAAPKPPPEPAVADAEEETPDLSALEVAGAGDMDPVEEARLNAIDIPDDWDDMTSASLRNLARDITKNSRLSKRADCMEAISEELARRAG